MSSTNSVNRNSVASFGFFIATSAGVGFLLFRKVKHLKSPLLLGLSLSTAGLATVVFSRVTSSTTKKIKQNESTEESSSEEEVISQEELPIELTKVEVNAETLERCLEENQHLKHLHLVLHQDLRGNEQKVLGTLFRCSPELKSLPLEGRAHIFEHLDLLRLFTSLSSLSLDRLEIKQFNFSAPLHLQSLSIENCIVEPARRPHLLNFLIGLQSPQI